MSEEQPQLSIELTGSQLAICLMACVWVSDCPFGKAIKPADLESAEVEAIWNKLSEMIVQLREAGFAEPMVEYAHLIPVPLSARELELTIRCIEAVLDECEGDPLELSLRCGEVDQVVATKEFLKGCR